jgi:putative spermidine/putrescine transport system permease protein
MRRLLAELPFRMAAFCAYTFLLAPIVVVALASLEGELSYHFEFPPRHLSLAWYGNIPVKYFHAFGVSLVVATASALLATSIGAAAALGIVRGNVPGKELLQAFFRLPLQIPLVVTGVVFLQFYYQLVDIVGANLLGTWAGLIAAHVFITIPYGVGAVGAVLQRANPRLEEAARIAGASELAVFRRVTLPLMLPGLFAGFFYAFIVSFGDVPVSLFLASGKFVTLPVEIFQTLLFDFDPAVLALSTLIVVFSLVLIVAAQRLASFDLVLPSGKR